MKIVIDSSLSPRLARILNDLLHPSHSVVHARDISGKMQADADICEYMKANAPALFIAQDLETNSQPHRMAVLTEMKCHIALMASGWLDIKPGEQAWMLVRVFPRILKRLEKSMHTETIQISPGPKAHIRTLA